MFLPQMAPLWWTSLMVMFILSFMFVMSMLYFNYQMNQFSQMNIIKKKMNWKW